ncbi:MAG TPA: spore germination protein [Paenibacillus sp.]|uniref:spore germination protein n=1 Tax=Paenibacillus sp. TaxID=58172 RepID=UPI0028D783DB|nr:spore germination protein [Paenibacillus sp.]HUC92185.1 spore germination protein [Paenibacillus sp.]
MAPTNDTFNALQEAIGDTADFHSEEFLVGKEPVTVSWLTSMTDGQMIADKIIAPLAISADEADPAGDETRLGKLLRRHIPASQLKQTDSGKTAVQLLLAGYVLLRSRQGSGWHAVEAAAQNYRSVTEPSTQTIIRGPKEGFTESAEVSIGLLRKRLRNPNLRFERFTVGKETETPVYLAFVSNIVNEGILREARQRMRRIEINSVFDSGNLEELITDKIHSPFPLVYNSERPDTIASHLLAGKVALIVEGSPFVLTVPVVFQDFFQISEDYYQPYMMSSFIRFIRYLSFLLALLLPSIYVSLITFHQELVPTEFLLSVMAQREGIPFPAAVEAFLMEVTFEILREAGIRMPRAIGATVSIVGGLVIGQAAVEAGIISNIMVIIVALTAISSFVSPIYSFSISTRLLRFVLILLGASLGMYGVLLGMIVMVLHLSSLRSFGVPYLTPFAPFKLKEMKDVMLRFPIKSLKKRPVYLKTKKPLKQE